MSYIQQRNTRGATVATPAGKSPVVSPQKNDTEDPKERTLILQLLNHIYAQELGPLAVIYCIDNYTHIFFSARNRY